MDVLFFEVLGNSFFLFPPMQFFCMQLQPGPSLEGARRAMAPTLFQNLLRKGAYNKIEKNLIFVALPVLKSYRGPWIAAIYIRQDVLHFKKIAKIILHIHVIETESHISDIKSVPESIFKHFFLQFILLPTMHNELKRGKKSILAGHCTVCLNH